MGENMNLVQKF
jgi:hypothetical protein